MIRLEQTFEVEFINGSANLRKDFGNSFMFSTSLEFEMDLQSLKGIYRISRESHD